MKISKGNQNPYIKEEQTTQWPKEYMARFHNAILTSFLWIDQFILWVLSLVGSKQDYKISIFCFFAKHAVLIKERDSHGRDHMVVGFTITCAISAYHHLSCEFKSCSWWGAFNTILCDKVCQWLATGRWFSPGNSDSSTNRTDRHDTTEILL